MAVLFAHDETNGRKAGITNPGTALAVRVGETSKMPKIKTKSAAKKRFKVTGTGKVKAGVAHKRHRLISNSPERTRTLRGTAVLSESETQRVKRWMPYGGGF